LYPRQAFTAPCAASRRDLIEVNKRARRGLMLVPSAAAVCAAAISRKFAIMSFNHAVVWIDHSDAHILGFNAEASEAKQVHAHSSHKKQHLKSGIPGSGHAPEDQGYYHEVAEGLAPAGEILIVGPASAKLALLKHLQKHDPVLAGKVVGIESVDHPSDGQLLAYARHYFIGADRMRGDAGLKAG
jgi:hypothetical protein